MNIALGTLYAWSVFVTPLEAQFGWKRADTSMVFTIAVIVFALSFVVAGRIQDQFGPLWCSLAGGILVDALLIRMAIVPSIMMLFGKANWWFPAWLDRILPKLSVDADDLDTSNMPEDPGPEPQPELAGSLK